MQRWHLAQVNVARLVAPLDHPRLQGFVESLEPVNALADASPGFVWRLQTDDGDATSIRAFDDETVIVNLSVWESLDALHGFVYRSPHTQVMRQRREWFHPFGGAYLALWWVPAGHVPDVAEAAERLATLQAEGPSPRAFTFRSPHPPPDAGADGATGPQAAERSRQRRSARTSSSR